MNGNAVVKMIFKDPWFGEFGLPGGTGNMTFDGRKVHKPEGTIFWPSRKTRIADLQHLEGRQAFSTASRSAQTGLSGNLSRLRESASSSSDKHQQFEAGDMVLKMLIEVITGEAWVTEEDKTDEAQQICRQPYIQRLVYGVRSEVTFTVSAAHQSREFAQSVAQNGSTPALDSSPSLNAELRGQRRKGKGQNGLVVQSACFEDLFVNAVCETAHDIGKVLVQQVNSKLEQPKTWEVLHRDLLGDSDSKHHSFMFCPPAAEKPAHDQDLLTIDRDHLLAQILALAASGSESNSHPCSVEPGSPVSVSATHSSPGSVEPGSASGSGHQSSHHSVESSSIVIQEPTALQAP